MDSKNESPWINRGDKNYIMHGGLLMRKLNTDKSVLNAYDDVFTLDGYYDVFCLCPLDDAKNGSDGEVYVALAEIDTDDCLEMIMDDKSFPKDDIEMNDDMSIIQAAVEYWGIDNFAPSYFGTSSVYGDGPKVTRKQAKEWLVSLGVDESLLVIDEW